MAAFRYEDGISEASKTVFGPPGVDFDIVRGSHLGPKLGHKSIFLGFKKQVLKTMFFEGAPSSNLEAKTVFLEGLFGGFLGPCWHMMKSQK